MKNKLFVLSLITFLANNSMKAMEIQEPKKVKKTFEQVLEAPSFEMEPYRFVAQSYKALAEIRKNAEAIHKNNNLKFVVDISLRKIKEKMGTFSKVLNPKTSKDIMLLINQIYKKFSLGTRKSLDTSNDRQSIRSAGRLLQQRFNLDMYEAATGEDGRNPSC